MEESAIAKSSQVEKVIVSISDLVFEDDVASTRSDVINDGTRLKMSWISGDAIGVYPDKGLFNLVQV